MSEKLLTGQAGQEADMGYQPLPEAKPDDGADTFGSDASELARAAKELEDSREEIREPAVRTYGENDRPEERPNRQAPEHTITAERGADDLTAERNAEFAAQQQEAAENLARETDRIRAAALGIDLDALQAQQQQQQQQQSQPDVTPVEPTQGLSPKVAAAVADPEIRSAITAEIQEKTQAAEVARQAYITQSMQLAQMTTANILSVYAPEIGQLPANQWAGALQMKAMQNPQWGREDGFYKEEGDTVVIVTQAGLQRYNAKREPIKQKLKDGEDPRRVAWRLVKNNVPKRNSGFNRRLPYFNLGKI